MTAAAEVPAATTRRLLVDLSTEWSVAAVAEATGIPATLLIEIADGTRTTVTGWDADTIAAAHLALAGCLARYRARTKHNPPTTLVRRRVRRPDDHSRDVTTLLRTGFAAGIPVRQLAATYDLTDSETWAALQRHTLRAAARDRARRAAARLETAS